MSLSVPELKRYARQMILLGWGQAAQEKINKARVLMVGAGGLGSPCLLYLAAMGVGQLSIMDADRLALSNLHRQIVHDTENLDKPKAQSAAAKLHALNPHINITPIEKAYAEDNADCVADYDVIIDGSDNFKTRFLLNDFCYAHQRPLVSAALLQMAGQITVIKAYESGANRPCLRCLFPQEPAADAAASCAVGGVFPAVAGILGAMQAQETIKLITNLGTPLLGGWAQYDGANLSLRILKISRDPDCPLCAGATQNRQESASS